MARDGSAQHRIGGPAMARLEWLLDGLAGRADWGKDAAEVLAPAFTARVAPDVFVERFRGRAATHAPLTVVALEGGATTARARVRRHADGTAGPSVDVVTCTIEPDEPHRIVAAYTTALVPDHVTPRLPADFSRYPLDRAPGARLIVFSGVPGVGKSTLADAVGARLGVPVFAVHCVCSDPVVHRARLEGRTRGIPGWHDAGLWPNVEQRMARFPPWPEGTLTVDTTGRTRRTWPPCSPGWRNAGGGTGLPRTRPRAPCHRP
ncbi:AAA family ATPase [Streptomyces sp. CA2R106]|uniref:AAA family ATPase n=1 Tax=Streptomyces sp. CA2R106 TaxID=3120153 RepID=UPI00300A6D4B